MLKSMKSRVVAAMALVLASVTPAFAVTDYSDLTDAISFTEVGPAVLTAAGALVGIYVIIRGIKFVLGFAKSG